MSEKLLNQEEILTQLTELFKLQNDFQVKAMGQNDWWNVKEMNGKPVNYAIATIAEMAEAMESIDFKWWGTGSDDLVNFGVELIDMLHFEISNSMRAMSIRFNEFSVEKLLEEDNPIIKGLAADIFKSQTNGVSTELNKEEFYTLLLQLVGISATLSSKKLYSTPMLAETLVINVRFIFDMLKLLGVSFPEVCNKYKLKNALNHVRKLNGYKEGKYLKNWVSVSTGVQDEDNKIALELVKGQTLSFKEMIELLDGYYKKNIAILVD